MSLQGAEMADFEWSKDTPNGRITIRATSTQGGRFFNSGLDACAGLSKGSIYVWGHIGYEPPGPHRTITIQAGNGQ